MIKVHCIDHSNDRIVFTAAGLKFITESFPELSFEFNEETVRNYPAIFRFLNIRKENQVSAGTVKLAFSDFNSIPFLLSDPGIIIFPIIFRDELDKFNLLPNVPDFGNSLIPVTGKGSVLMPEMEWLYDYILRKITEPIMKNKRVLISAGPTIEDIDPVRFLTNRSTGKMGIALARAAFILGADVELVIGPTSEKVPEYCRVSRVRSASQMAEAIIQKFKLCDLYLGSAAVADFTPVKYHNQKIKKKNGLPEISLKSTTDILSELALLRKRQIMIGFSVETKDEIDNSRIKMQKKNLDMIVINNPSQKGSAFAADTNLVTILTKDGKQITLPLMSKFDVGLKIFEISSRFK